MKWSVNSVSTIPASSIASSSSLLSHDYLSLTLISPNRMTSITFGANSNTCSMQRTSGSSCGGTYVPTTYHILDPYIRNKLATFCPKLTIPSTFHPASSLQKTNIPPVPDLRLCCQCGVPLSLLLMNPVGQFRLLKDAHVNVTLSQRPNDRLQPTHPPRFTFHCGSDYISNREFSIDNLCCWSHIV